jgi:tRNA modification GTPase
MEHGDSADTIAAIATPPGSGGVGIVRISGPAADTILARVTGRAPGSLAARQLVRCQARDASGVLLDEILAVRMPRPHSYTGDDVVELHGHGGTLSLGRVLMAAVAAGARPAAPGEFTRRAFENGKLDLAQAEAVAQVIGAASDRALRVAQAQLAGALGSRVEALSARLIAALAELEAAIDFPEDDLELDAGSGSDLARLETELGALVASHRTGQVLEHGVSVALVGATNAGKSSLMNALLGRERAVVSAEPGTTRDFIEASVVWDGVPVTLVDTVGERADAGVGEQRGLELGRARTAHAEIIVRVLDATAPASGDAASLVVWNKCDLKAAPAGALGVSARSGAGLDVLRARLLERARGGAGAGEREDEIVVSARQAALFVEAQDRVAESRRGLAQARPLELVAADLRGAARALAEVVGREVTPEVLDAIFARFCIGK